MIISALKKYIPCLVLLLASLTVKAQTHELIRSTPEAEGISSEYVKQFLDSILAQPKAQVHSCIIMRHGRVIAEIYPKPWKAEYSHTLYSASKTFTAAAVGLCIQDSLIHLEDSIYRYLDEHFPANASDTLKSITIRDLLTMQSGIPVDTRMRASETQWLNFYFNQKAKALPGSMFAYDSIVTYMLSAIVQKVTGNKLFDFLNDRLFKPLHITTAAWEQSPTGINCGGWGLYLQPESMAKFGQLLLREGRWNGYNILPSDWVDEMMKPQSTTNKYGYQMWIGTQKGWAEANGAYGQFILIMPKEDMVITITSCCHGSMPYQKFAEKFLSRHLKNHALSITHKTIEVKKNGRVIRSTQIPNYLDKLRQLQSTCTLPTVKGSATSSKHTRPITVEFSSNCLCWQKVQIKPELNNEMKLTITDTAKRTYTITVTNGKWTESAFKGEPYNPRPFQNNFSNLPKTWHVAGSYAWADSQSLHIRLNWVDWLSSAEVIIKFSGATATLFVKGQDTGKTVSYKAWVK